MKRAACLIVVLMAAMPGLVLSEEPVYFADPNVKAFVESRLGLDPTPTDMLGLTYLNCNMKGISDLTGLETATNLTELWLGINQISDISALAGLTNLTYLHLWDNQISDISAVAGLTNLTFLWLSDNQISDISAVAGLTNLTKLYLSNNQISDISALSGLMNLRSLFLKGNPLNQDACYIYIPLIRQNNPARSPRVPPIHLNYDPCPPPPPRTLTISSTSGGSVTIPGEGTFEYDHGTDVSIEATAEANYHFVNWTGTAVDAGKVASPNASSTSVTVDDDYTLRANFAAETPIIELPTVTTRSATSVGETSATLRGRIDDDGGEACQYRFRYKQSGGFYSYTSWTGSKTTGQSFSRSITSGLSPGSLYYFNARAKNSADQSDWGNEENFTTEEIQEEGPYISSIEPSSGAPGIPVTIKGIRFPAYPQVNFGGKLIPAESWSENEIVVKVPAGKGGVDVSLGTITGVVLSNSVKFTYKDPVIHNIDPPSGRAGEQVTISGEDFGYKDSSPFFWVKFGKTTSVTTSAWTDTEIVAKAPSDFGTGISDKWMLIRLIKYAVFGGPVKEVIKEIFKDKLTDLFGHGIRIPVAEGKIEVDVRVITGTEKESNAKVFTYDVIDIDLLEIILSSPGELRVYDSHGNVTGLVNGEVREEIPDSTYDVETKSVMISPAIDSYYYEVAGTGDGTYGLSTISLEEGSAITFEAIDIPTTPGQNHQYTIDWQALSAGEEGVILNIDADGDGIFEQTVTLDTVSLTVNVVGGHGTATHVGVTYYEVGTTSTVTAVPGNGYCVKGWYDADGVLLSEEPSIEVLMDWDKTISVEFMEMPILGMEIYQIWDYNDPMNPDDLKYVFDLTVDTNEIVDLVEVLTPTGHTFQIPKQEYTDANGVEPWYSLENGTYYWEVETWYSLRENGTCYWEYEADFNNPAGLLDYGDGTYTITVHYASGGQAETTALFVDPNNGDPIPQPTHEPVLTFPDHNGTATSPVTFTWQPCTDVNATSIWLSLEKQDANEVIDINFPTDATSSDPITLSEGTWEAKLCFNHWYDVNNADVIPISVGKYSSSRWIFTTVADPLSEALDTALSFSTGGDADWFSQTTTSRYDGDAAQSGDISNNRESWMQTTVSGAGTVSFYWKVSSETHYDYLEFYIDGELQDRISGTEDWQQMTYTITASDSHTLEWRYTKDQHVSSGSDCGWVDKVEWGS